MAIVIHERISFIIKVTHPGGLKIRDRAASQSEGAKQVGASLPTGTRLLAYGLLYPRGVTYASLVSDDPQHPELFCRVAEVGGYNSKEGIGTYCQVIPLISTVSTPSPLSTQDVQLLRQARENIDQVLRD